MSASEMTQALAAEPVHAKHIGGRRKAGSKGREERASAAADALPVFADGTAAAAGPGATDPHAEPFKDHFELRPDGVHWLSENKDGIADQWVCSWLNVAACTRGEDGTDWGRWLEWRDPDHRTHTWAMPMSMLAGADGRDVRAELLRRGLRIASYGRLKILDYLNWETPSRRLLCVGSTGWHQGRFVLPDAVIGDEAGDLVYQHESGVTARFGTAGNLDGWRERIGALCNGNSRLTFAVSAALAGPLLHLAGDESGGFHLRGISSGGKSSALKAAASVWGAPDYRNTWKGTDNGIEAQAEAHNDCALILDELGQADPRHVGESCYMLMNGAGKLRAYASGAGRNLRRWRVLLLSAGEIGLADLMRDAGKRVRAGQEVRLADIPADAGCGMGVFDTLHGRASAAAMGKDLSDACGEHYGHVGAAFLSELVKNADKLPGTIKRQRAEWLAAHLTHKESPQVLRVAGRFALAAIAGEWATAKGLTGWTAGEAGEAAATCFRAWLESRAGGDGDAERAQMLAQVRGFIEQHGQSRFQDMGREREGEHQVVINRVGFRETDGIDTTYYVTPESWRSEVCQGLDCRAVARAVSDAGWLLPGDGKNRMRRQRLPGLGNVRAYALSAAAMFGEVAA